MHLHVHLLEHHETMHKWLHIFVLFLDLLAAKCSGNDADKMSRPNEYPCKLTQRCLRLDDQTKCSDLSIFNNVGGQRKSETRDLW